MTTITITKSSDGSYKQIECNGHAGFAQFGEDIVCAAISVLTINTINSVEKFTDDKILTSQNEEKGILRLLVMPLLQVVGVRYMGNSTML